LKDFAAPHYNYTHVALQQWLCGSIQLLNCLFPFFALGSQPPGRYKIAFRFPNALSRKGEERIKPNEIRAIAAIKLAIPGNKHGTNADAAAVLNGMQEGGGFFTPDYIKGIYNMRKIPE
jgi:hypothetical protein